MWKTCANLCVNCQVLETKEGVVSGQLASSGSAYTRKLQVGVHGGGGEEETVVLRRPCMSTSATFRIYSTTKPNKNIHAHYLSTPSVSVLENQRHCCDQDGEIEMNRDKSSHTSPPL